MAHSDPVTAQSTSEPPAAGPKEERLEYKLALAFGFMSFIPILIVLAAMLSGLNLTLALFCMAGSAFIGYFFIARRMISSVVTIAHKVRQITNGELPDKISVEEHNEIGELARSFNRITQELEQKIDQLESSRQLVKKLLARIGTAIVSYEGIDNLLTMVLENTANALEAEMGTLLLVDGEKQELCVKSTWSNNGQVADALQRIPLGDGLLGWVAKEGRPLRSREKAALFGFSHTHGEESAVLCVPLKLHDHPMGVITVLREDPGRAFTDDDEALLGSIGSQVAVAIENYRLNLDVERTYVETILALALAVEAKDPYSAGHSKRVGFYASKIAEHMGLDAEHQRALNHAGVLHDIGKIGIKDDILLKPAPLTPDEQKIMQQHSVIGEAIVKPVRSLSQVVALVRHHHERYDGGGYPGGLKGEDIPMGARILAVADTYDAMVTDRPYRKRLSVEQARAELKRNAGVQHDPVVVEAFLRYLDEKVQRQAAAKGDDDAPPV